MGAASATRRAAVVALVLVTSVGVTVRSVQAQQPQAEPVGTALELDPPATTGAEQAGPTASGTEAAAASADSSGRAAGGDSTAGTATAPRVAVLILGTAGVSADTTDSLTEALIGALAARGPTSIVGKEELQALLGQNERASLECVSSAACLGRVGVQVGVSEMIAGTLAKRDGRWVFNLNRIDIQTGGLEGRVFREVAGDEGDLADALLASVPHLFDVVRRPATLSIATVRGAEVLIDGLLIGVVGEGPVRQDDLPAGRHEVVVRARGHHEYHRTIQLREGVTFELEPELEPLMRARISPFVWLGGAVALAGVTTGLVFGVLSQATPGPGLTRAEAVAFFDARQGQATLANVSFATAAAGALLAGIFLYLGAAEEPVRTESTASPRLDVSVAPNAVSAALRGAF